MPTINLTMVCPECKAVVNYVYEPDVVWHTDRRRLKALVEAKQWVGVHPKSNLAAEVVWGKAPLYASCDPMTGDTYVMSKETRYLNCPVCGGRMYRGEDAYGLPEA